MSTARPSTGTAIRLGLWAITAGVLVASVTYRKANFEGCYSPGTPHDTLTFLAPVVAVIIATFFSAWPRLHWFWALLLAAGAFCVLYVGMVVAMIALGTVCIS